MVEPMDVAVLAFGPDALRCRADSPAAFVEMCVSALRGHSDLQVESLTSTQWRALEQAMMAALAEASSESLASRAYLVDDAGEPLTLAFYREMADRLPSDSRVQAVLAKRLIATGEPELAASVLWRAVERAPTPRLLVDLGFLLVKLRRRDEAERLAAIARGLCPEHPDVEHMIRTVRAPAAWASEG